MIDLSLDETIAALSSARGSSERGILRLAGSKAWAAVKPFFSPADCSPPERPARSSILRGSFNLWGPERSIPVRLYFWPDGTGYTGSEAVELHLPGSPPILDGVLRTLCDTGMVRLARPGEFTLRAFLAGRLDLTRAEAVLGVIDAESDRSLKSALHQLAGNLSEPLAAIREELCETLARLEAGFDFSDEDIEFITPEELQTAVQGAAESVERALRRMESRTLLGSAHRAALVGRPNAGKSSLFNRMTGRFGAGAGRARGRQTGRAFSPLDAIVSSTAGTTRDRLEAELSLGGLTLTLIDTAGIELDEEESARKISAEDGAVLFCVEAERMGKGIEALDSWERDILRDLRSGRTVGLTVITKGDRGIGPLNFPDAILTSAVAETVETAGLDRLADRLAALFAGGEAVPATAVRCRAALGEAADALRRAAVLIDGRRDEALLATELRAALDAVGRVTGAVTTDDILDRVFSRFCVGK